MLNLSSKTIIFIYKFFNILNQFQRISKIVECQPGADKDLAKDITDDSRVLTIVCSGETTDGAPRVVVLQVDSRDERNSLQTGLRAMVSDIQMNAITFEVSSPPPAQPERRASIKNIPAPTSESDRADDPKSKVMRRPSLRTTVLDATAEQAAPPSGHQRSLSDTTATSSVASVKFTYLDLIHFINSQYKLG